MQINDTIVKQAIHRILREQGLRVGGWTSLSRLKQSWAATGLRNSDLLAGLNMLRDEHYVSMRDLADDCMVTVLRRQIWLGPQALAAMPALSRTSKRLPFGKSRFERRARA